MVGMTVGEVWVVTGFGFGSKAAAYPASPAGLACLA